MNVGESRIVTASWGPLNKHIYAGHENGDVSVWDWQVLLTHTYTCKKKQKQKNRILIIANAGWKAGQCHQGAHGPDHRLAILRRQVVLYHIIQRPLCQGVFVCFG